MPNAAAVFFLSTSPARKTLSGGGPMPAQSASEAPAAPCRRRRLRRGDGVAGVMQNPTGHARCAGLHVLDVAHDVDKAELLDPILQVADVFGRDLVCG
eukprot:3033805-Lingulodinium_polyedra.AAC.1